MENIFSSRRIAKACRQNINFMWLLNGNEAPSHGMINSFRKHVLGGCIEILFYAFVNYLEQVGEVRYENVFIDGTKIEANAGKYTYVWRESIERREREMRVKAREFIKTINEREGTCFIIDENEFEKSIGEVMKWIGGNMSEDGEKRVQSANSGRRRIHKRGTNISKRE
jgi:hypothetical protein